MKITTTYTCPTCNYLYVSTPERHELAAKHGRSDCPICSAHHVMPGVNDALTMLPIIGNFWSPKNSYSLSDVTLSSNKRGIFVCPECHTEFITSIQKMSRAIADGDVLCPTCSDHSLDKTVTVSKKVQHKPAEYFSETLGATLKMNDGKYATCIAYRSTNDIDVMFEDGFVLNHARWSQFKRGTLSHRPISSAPKAESLLTRYPSVSARWSSKNTFGPDEISFRSGKHFRCVCPDCNQEFSTTAANLTRALDNGKTGCPYCSGKKIIPGFNDLVTRFPKAAKMWSSNNTFAADTVAPFSNKMALFVCPICGCEFEAPIYSVAKALEYGNLKCPRCHKNLSRKKSVTPEKYFTEILRKMSSEKAK